MKIKSILIILLMLIIVSSVGIKNISYASTADDIMNDADNFLDKGKTNGGAVDTEKLQVTSNFLYNLLLAVGIVLAVIVGMIIGIQYMLGSVSQRADLKKALIGYVISCVVIFGAFGIWKIAMNILSNI